MKEEVLMRMECGKDQEKVYLLVEKQRKAEALALQTWRTPVYIGAPVFCCRNNFVILWRWVTTSNIFEGIQSANFLPIVASAVGVVLLAAMCAYIGYQQFKMNRAILRNEWRIPFDTVELSRNRPFQSRITLKQGSRASQLAPESRKTRLFGHYVLTFLFTESHVVSRDPSPASVCRNKVLFAFAISIRFCPCECRTLWRF